MISSAPPLDTLKVTRLSDVSDRSGSDESTSSAFFHFSQTGNSLDVREVSAWGTPLKCFGQMVSYVTLFDGARVAGKNFNPQSDDSLSNGHVIRFPRRKKIAHLSESLNNRSQ